MPAMLLQLYDRLGLGNRADALFWAICLVAFYDMFHKFHLLPVLTSSFDLCKQLTKAGFRIFPWGYITIRWSKTIQFLERIVEIPLPCIPRSKLCPTAAITNTFCFTATASAFNSQVFNWVDQKQLVNLWILCVHPANSFYIPWFRPQAVCWALFSEWWGALCIPSCRTHQID